MSREFFLEASLGIYMFPKIFHLTAKSKDLTWEENRLLNRLSRINPGWEVRLWDDADNLMLVRSEFPEYLELYSGIGKGVAKADVARYMYMYVYGGVYLDTDYKVFKPFDLKVNDGFCYLPLSRGSCQRMFDESFRLGNAVLISTPRHPFWLTLLADIFARVKATDISEDVVEITTGPEALTKTYLQSYVDDKTVIIPDRLAFHPPLVLGGFSARTDSSTFGAHLCWGSWRSQSIKIAIRNLARRKICTLY